MVSRMLPTMQHSDHAVIDAVSGERMEATAARAAAMRWVCTSGAGSVGDASSSSSMLKQSI